MHGIDIEPDSADKGNYARHNLIQGNVYHQQELNESQHAYKSVRQLSLSTSSTRNNKNEGRILKFGLCRFSLNHSLSLDKSKSTAESASPSLLNMRTRHFGVSSFCNVKGFDN